MFEITPQGRAFIDALTRLRGGNAPWVRAQSTPVRHAAASPLSRAA